ncbi:glycosyltransferase family 2 protein [Phaeobacter porticola]|uniref:Putative glycosyl transferase n=1 Tax=Phaeobacter porticola TaxID=1844006 RepID=A0A1L3IA55_9RHOB|nr:glycosyltransferase family 2 protein [Phaeobacter porticola]APG48921.1 putative glycosyl transferase [Phaeobacter porticola]
MVTSGQKGKPGAGSSAAVILDVTDVHAAGEIGAERILVVIPTLNEAIAILPCLKSLQRDPVLRDPGRCTVVVVDGGSEDDTVAIVQSYAETAPCAIHVLHNPDRIQSAGINLAVAEFGTGFDLLLRCDAHAIYPNDYATALRTALRADDDRASVVVAMDSEGRTDFGKAAAWVVDTPLGSGGAAHRGGTRSGYVDHGHHAMMDLQWFRKVGGYDPSFSHNEDAELDWRLSQAGARIWLAGEVRLGYVMRDTAAALWRQYLNYGAGRAATLQKHQMRPRLRQMVPVVNLILCALALLLAPVWPWVLLWPGVYLGAILAVTALACLQLGAVGLWSGVALVVMHMGWATGVLRSAVRYGLRNGQNPSGATQRDGG